MRLPRTPSFAALLVLALASAPLAAQAGGPVVRAVLFYSPTCPHCHLVMSRDLPPLTEKYGERFQIVAVNVTTQGGGRLYEATADQFDIPLAERGVPLLVVGDRLLSGSEEIPEQLPGLIERALAEDGIDWPEVPLVRQALAEQGLLDTPAQVLDSAAPLPEAGAAPRVDTAADPIGERPAVPAPAGPSAEARPSGADRDSAAAGESAPVTGAARPAAPEPAALRPLVPGDSALAQVGWRDRLRQDPGGNAMALTVLVGLLMILVFSALAARSSVSGGAPLPVWIVPVLGLLGIGMAAYLSFVEITGHEAVCGPVGDCNTVQQSAYARLFGVLPIGVLGLGGYVALLVAWGLARSRSPRVRAGARKGFWGMAFLGTAFSTYLTFLEPFVIGATCAWCIGSAVIMAALLLVATSEVRRTPA